MSQKNYCKCGCNQEIPPLTKKGKPRYFKNGHYGYKFQKGNEFAFKKGSDHIMYGVKGKDNPNWIGDRVGYWGVHDWIRKNKQKPETCEGCDEITSKLDCCNISGEYHRDVNDYVYLCRSDHMILDYALGLRKSYIRTPEIRKKISVTKKKVSTNNHLILA